jgi:hypothetical protein
MNLLRQVLGILEIFARIQILRPTPEKTDTDPYKNLRIFYIKFFFSVVLECKDIHKYCISLTVKNSISSQKLRDIS